MPLESIEQTIDTDADQWQARVDLAAAHRLAVLHGFHEGIFNHLTLRVPGTDDRYYQIPFGLHWSEVNASCFMEIGYDGTRLAGAGEIERSAYCIHSPIHRLNANAAGNYVQFHPRVFPDIVAAHRLGHLARFGPCFSDAAADPAYRRNCPLRDSCNPLTAALSSGMGTTEISFRGARKPRI